MEIHSIQWIQMEILMLSRNTTGASVTRKSRIQARLIIIMGIIETPILMTRRVITVITEVKTIITSRQIC